MIKSLQLHILLKKTAGISLYNGIHTDSVLFAKSYRRKIPRALPDEPGMRIRRSLIQENSDYDDEVIDEVELDESVDMMNVDKLCDMDVRQDRRFREKVKLKIAAKKFFAPRPQPSMLTYNEKLCIRHLHKQDPVQWNLKALSESFPATTDTIKKIIRSKWKMSPERGKAMDVKVQKNWELLAKGELDADPHVLEHLKKFVNRREILLEQIKNEKFYLPEIKNEPVWNQGEMNSIITEYENKIQKLVRESGSSPQAITDGVNEVKDEKKKTSYDLLQEQIETKHKSVPEWGDSFKFGHMIKTFSKSTTLEELENEILRKADREELELEEKVILENKLGVRRDSYEDLTEPPKGETHEKSQPEKVHKKSNKRVESKTDYMPVTMEPEEPSPMMDYPPPPGNTISGSEVDVRNILSKIQSAAQDEGEEKDLSHEDRIQIEKAHYDKEVLHIKNTAFWGDKRSSKEKAIAELEKPYHDEPMTDGEVTGVPKIFLFSPDPYPERIKIPKNQRGSGLTFRIKDCYYDDDGEFLYRVPGMTK